MRIVGVERAWRLLELRVAGGKRREFEREWKV